MTNFNVYLPRLRNAVALLVAIGLVAVALIFTQRVSAVDQEVQKLNRFMQTNKGNAASMETFRQGRDMIEAQNWQKAAEKFAEFIRVYPRDKDLDAALYWYGYSLQKQNLKEDASKPLLRLIERFPGSSWRREAEALLVMMGYQAKVNEGIARDNCEIKVLALQSLFQADEERAIGVVMEALKANSATCPGFQGAAVSMLGSHSGGRAVPILLDIARSNSDLKLRLTAIKRLGEQHTEQITEELIKIYDADRTKEIRSQIMRALVESRTQRGSAKVIEIARSGDDLALRQAAIRYLSDSRDASSLEALLSLYDTDKTPEIRAQILRTLSERDDPRARAKILEVARTGETPEIRLEAIRRLGDHGRISIEDLIQLYTSETNLQLKQGILRAFADNKDPRARAKLLDIARGNDPAEIRAFAIRVIGDRDDEATVDQLIALYGTEQNLQIRSALLRAFGDSKQKSAVRKLMEIARTDSSVELRKLAVRYLGDSKDPEALKFLEELLK